MTQRLTAYRGVRHIGLHIDEHLTFQPQVEKVCGAVFGKIAAFRHGRKNLTPEAKRTFYQEYITPPECATPIQLCIGSWSSGIGSSDVMRTLHTSARPVSRQGTIVFDPRVPAAPRVPLRFVRYYDAKIRFRSTKTLCRAGPGVAHSGGYVLLVLFIHICAIDSRLCQ